MFSNVKVALYSHLSFFSRQTRLETIKRGLKKNLGVGFYVGDLLGSEAAWSNIAAFGQRRSNEVPS
jgi:hypothetical protein